MHFGIVEHRERDSKNRAQLDTVTESTAIVCDSCHFASLFFSFVNADRSSSHQEARLGVHLWPVFPRGSLLAWPIQPFVRLLHSLGGLKAGGLHESNHLRHIPFSTLSS